VASPQGEREGLKRKQNTTKVSPTLLSQTGIEEDEEASFISIGIVKQKLNALELRLK